MITAKQALDTLEQVVADKGQDYIYPMWEGWFRVGGSERKRHVPDIRCFSGEWQTPQGVHAEFASCAYLTHDDKPSCIVGHVMHRLGVSHEVLRREEGSTCRVFGDELDRAAIEVLLAAQQMQDHYHTWGEALDVARQVARTYGAST